MHITAGDGQRARGRAAPGVLNGGAVRAAKGQHFALISRARFFRGGDERLAHQGGGHHGAIHVFHRRARAQLHRRQLHLGGVAPGGHIQAHAQIGGHLIGRRGGAADAHFFLRGEHGHHMIAGLLQGQHQFAQQRAGAAIVHRRGGHPVRAQGVDFRRVYAHIAQGNQLFRFRPAFRADIHEQVLHARRFALGGLAYDHAPHSVFKNHGAGFAHIQGNAAHVGHPQETLFFNIRHRQADLIHMGGKHDGFAARPALLFHDKVAHHIDAGAVDLPRQQFLNPGGHRVLPARGAVYGQQRFQCIQHHLRNPPFCSPAPGESALGAAVHLRLSHTLFTPVPRRPWPGRIALPHPKASQRS